MNNANISSDDLVDHFMISLSPNDEQRKRKKLFHNPTHVNIAMKFMSKSSQMLYITEKNIYTKNKANIIICL